MSGIFQSRLFYLGLLVRLALFPFFGSHYLNDLFIPFLDTAVLNIGSNPWSLSPPAYFPYGSVLFAILFFPRYVAYLLVGDAALGAGPLGMALVKLPLLGLEVLLLYGLVRMAKQCAGRLLPYYWLNPIPIFVCYVHGQLDVASMAFCVIAIYFLLAERTVVSAVAFAGATLCKFHVVAIAPLLVMYLWNRSFAAQALKRIAVWSAIWIVLSGAGFIPLITAERMLYVSTSSPEAMSLFSVYFKLGSSDLVFVGVLVPLAVLGRLCLSTRISDQGLVFGSATIFGAILLVSPPNPGWYFWVLPFLALFYTLYRNVTVLPFLAMILAYLLYFVQFKAYPPALADEQSLGGGIVATVLQTTLGGLLVALWVLVVREHAQLRGRAKPILIGIAGDSGAGKNFVSTLFADLFGQKQTVVVEGDDYHKWERSNEKWRDYTHLHPKANALGTLARHTIDLTRGLTVFQPHYDHATGVFTNPREIRPARTIIVQGLHTLFLRGLRSHFNMRLFLAPSDLVRLHWKLQRDVEERGHTPERVLDALQARAGQSNAHILPQRHFADWIIEYHSDTTLNENDVLVGRVPHVSVRHILWNDAPVQDLAEAYDCIPDCRAYLESQVEDLNRLALIFSGTPTAAQVAALARTLFPDLRHLTRARVPPVWQEGQLGMIQLLLVSLLRADGAR